MSISLLRAVIELARVLYNEGRVVGYSAYEIYIQQLKAVDPDATPATEKEWLASTK